jgi:Ca-activated chloride channel family protein
MLASDVAPSRLQRARLAILDYVQRRGHGRVGLVASPAAFLVPLTFDYGAFQDALMVIDDKAIPVPGTDVGRALDEAYRAMDKGARPKVLVLLTDGEDLEQGGVRTAALKEASWYSRWVGTPAGGEINW